MTASLFLRDFCQLLQVEKNELAQVRRTRPSQLMDLASCHLDALLPKEYVDRINKVIYVFSNSELERIRI